jgi:deoxyribonuclease V
LASGSRFSIEKARRLQLTLSEKVIRTDRLPSLIRYVAGVDVAYTGEHSIGAVAVFDYPHMRLVEEEAAQRTTRFPYISTLLSFRELPPVVSALRKLKMRPDVFLVDGHGLAHPYRLGFASHLGLVLDAPTIGVAKNLLCGEVRNEGKKRWKPVVHEGKVVGAAVFTKPGAKPIYVSIGHKVSLETAIDIVLHCVKNYRIPEPLREAHLTAERMKRMVYDKSLKKQL